MFSLDDIVKSTKGEVLSSPFNSFESIGTHSKVDLKNKIFIPLRGDRFDAHDFIEEAISNGASCIIYDKDSELNKKYIAQNKSTFVKVEDTLRALQDLASYWRVKLDAHIIGITGSTGKTTTKEFLATILESKYSVHWNEGSFNNHWGVPITLLGMKPDTEICIVEMGMNHPGELKKLCEIAQPNTVVVTNVGRAHIGELGSQEVIVQAKWEIYRNAPKHAFRIFNLDNEHTLRMYNEEILNKERKKAWTFSQFKTDSNVSLRAENIGLGFLEIIGHIGGVSGSAKVNISGRHNVSNLMAASTIALSLGMKPVDIWNSVSQVKTSWGRNQIVQLTNGSKVLFDGYNANPESVGALIKNMFEINIKGKKFLILGEMFELGSEKEKLHKEIGEMAGNADFDLVWFMGPSKEAFLEGIKSTSFAKKLIISDGYKLELASDVLSMIHPSDVVAIKGSRGMEMEKVLSTWSPIDFKSKN